MPKIVEVRLSSCGFKVADLTLNQLGSGKSVNYRGPFGFGLAFTRCKLTSPGIWGVCIEHCGFRESAQNGAATLIGPLWKSKRPARLRTHHPPHSTRQGLETDRNFIGAAPHCGPRPGGTSLALAWSVIAVKTGRKRGWWQSNDATELLTKKRQNGCQNIVFWCHVRSSKRFGRRFCRNRSNKK